MCEFKKTRRIAIGGKGITRIIGIGGDSPVSVQTMWKSSLIGADIQEIARILSELEMLGCDIVRFAVPDMESADILLRLAEITPMPLVADIHFDYRLALRCLDGNIAKIRINPGNIGSRERVKSVAGKARDTGTPIRIGVNSGSLPKDLQERIESVRRSAGDVLQARSAALTETAEREVAVFDELDFSDIIVSMKASSVGETIRSNREFASKHDIPLHLGVTEAGPVISGVVKSTIAFSRLLEDNIGATVRVSLSDSMENEVIAGREILAECGKRNGGVRIISCPRCGRNGFDVHSFVNRWQKKLLGLDKNITVAVMGCVVNGPGEGKHADIGITGAGDTVIVFRKGKTVRTIRVEPGDTAGVDAVFEEELGLL
ncbi:(E)-4-hydroxy-3-methylbut-2-enyl-diphosphate synthase [Brucepastera parasyntrophica]|uniref:(E)-4-hydroxy-3-methylbut-2-enyl-diphosphate synthase n=1 Tax=Brucepastera parasyntrophica TaxID=2880008 RepID=UPI00210CCB7B|nr:(E)-4-hydroxy-3-methylbut-2-enyl-diphosphate synthase [Brucepastera parasyntrophica]ULQ59828.1 (E)-4-hydroxy-3-methylbut-2-enyl-diphosphate synthase [Brucepastera parasyntrophica]